MSGTNFLLDNSLRSNNSGSRQLYVPAIGSRKVPVPGQPPEGDTFPSARYCLPDSYVMEISIESSRIRLMHVGLRPPPPPSPQPPRARIRGKVSVFLGRLAITRPPALTIPTTIGKAQYRTYGGSGRKW